MPAPATAAPAPRAVSPTPIAPALLLWLIAVALYAQTIPYDYALDDAIAIFKNPITQKGFGGFGELLTSDSFAGFFGGRTGQVAGGRYRPLSYLTFAAEVQFTGLQPAVGHMGNVLLYALTVVVLFLVIDGLFGRRRLAFVTALLFAVHPIHTEAVANIKGRDEILALLLALLALYVAMGGRRPEWQAAGAGLLFFLALLAKENAIAFIAIIPLALWLRKKPGREPAILPVVLSLGLALLAYLLLRGRAIGFGGPGDPGELLNNPFLGATASQRVATILHTWLLYLKLLVVPWPLTFDYYPWHIRWSNWSSPLPWASLAIHLALAVWAVRAARRRDIAGYAILYYFATFAIVSNLFFPIGAFMAERFVYMPSVGACLLVARLLEKINPRAANAILVTIALAYAAITVTRNPAWRNDFTLALTDVRTSSDSTMVRMIAGGQLWEVARLIDPGKPLPRDSRISFYLRRYGGSSVPAELKLRMLTEAEQNLRRSIEIYGRHLWAWQLLGNVSFDLGRYEQAIAAYERVLEVRPDFVHVKENLGVAALRLADKYEEAGNIDGAIAALQENTRRDPVHAEAFNNLGRLYAAKRDLPRAIAALERAASLEPREVSILSNLGIAYSLVGRSDDAFTMFQRALETEPSPNLLQNMRAAAHEAVRRGAVSPRVIRFLEEQAAANPDDRALAADLAAARK